MAETHLAQGRLLRRINLIDRNASCAIFSLPGRIVRAISAKPNADRAAILEGGKHYGASQRRVAGAPRICTHQERPQKDERKTTRKNDPLDGIRYAAHLSI